MDQIEKRKLENQLMTMGLAGLSDPALLDQLGILISAFPGDKHHFFEDLLGQCDADKRYEMYTAMAPKLHFKALPLADYQARINNRASELVSQRRMRVEGRKPDVIDIDGHKFYAVPEHLSEAAMATLQCCKCPKVERYISDTPAGAMIAARKAGWVRDKVLTKEVCSRCAKKLVLVS
jgi:hypothetical protein